MGHLQIKWYKRAESRVYEIHSWYRLNMGLTAANHFYADLLRTAELVAEMPTIGTPFNVCLNNKYTYYSVSIHPKYRLVYRFTSRTIYIVAIYCTMQRSSQL